MNSEIYETTCVICADSDTFCCKKCRYGQDLCRKNSKFK